MRKKEDLHRYQVAGAEHAVTNTHCGLFKEMGLGKTATTLTAIHRLMYEELAVDSVLVIAPKRVVELVWEQEAQEWEHLRGLTFSKIIGTPKQRLKALKTKADIYLIGRDSIVWLCGLYGGSALPFPMLVIDELSSFKSPKSLRFKALKGVRASFDRIIGLTGTPSPNGLLDLWSQLYLLDGGQRLGRFITGYKEKYFRATSQKGGIVYKYKVTSEGEKEIPRLISDICISMKAEDYLELPEKVINVVRIQMSDDLKQKYLDFEREQVLSVLNAAGTETEVTALNAAALANKLLQFANGAVYDENKSWHEVHSLKLEAVKDIIEEANGKPVLIAWTYRHDLERLQTYLKAYAPRELKTEEDLKAWNRGEVQVLLMHPASGGHGLNLQKGGNLIIWYGQTWSLELYQQFNARLHRQGQTTRVIINKLICEGTMDEDVIKAQEAKTAAQDGLMAAVKARIDKYTKK